MLRNCQIKSINQSEHECDWPIFVWSICKFRLSCPAFISFPVWLQMSSRKKMNITGPLKGKNLSCTLLGLLNVHAPTGVVVVCYYCIYCCFAFPDRNQGECDIFTAEKTATYLIYVEVKFPDERDETEDFIFMKQSWKEKSTQTIHHKKHRYSDASIVEEVKVMQESRVYLLFNSGNPQCSESVFHVYELWWAVLVSENMLVIPVSIIHHCTGISDSLKQLTETEITIFLGGKGLYGK